MSSPENRSRPHLEVVRSYESLPEDERIIEAYCEELLEDKDGKPRNFAFHGWTPYKHTSREWSRAVFRRSGDGYTISCYGEDRRLDPLVEIPHGDPMYQIEMQPYHVVFPGMKPPNGAKWYIQAGRPEFGAPHVTSNEPAYFRTWLEEIWGPLPRTVQKRLGVIQKTAGETPSPDDIA
jgi:hypothetical protein